MSHFHNVKTILECDFDNIVALILEEDAEELADDICYIVVTCLKSMGYHEEKRVRQTLIDEISNYEFKQIEQYEGDDNDPFDSGDISDGEEDPD